MALIGRSGERRAVCHQTSLAVDAQRWRPAILILSLSCLGIGMLFWPTMQSLMGTWGHSRTYAHGFLILPATFYMVWEYRARWVSIMPEPDARGLLWITGLALVWALAEPVAWVHLQQAALLAMVPALVLAICGGRVFTEVRFPMGLLVFALPAGAAVEPALRSLTADFVVGSLWLLDIPLSWEGHSVVLSSRTWDVDLDCGGLRYLLPGLALGYVYTGLMHQEVRHRIAFLVICALALTLGNGVRATSIILADHVGLTNDTDHRVFSYAIYGVIVIWLWRFGLRWNRLDHPVEPQAGMVQSSMHTSI